MMTDIAIGAVADLQRCMALAQVAAAKGVSGNVLMPKIH